MASYNRVILVGNLTRDPFIRYTPSGAAVCEIGLAVSRKFKQGNETKEEVTFVDVTFWGKTAEVVGQYPKKGASILVEGRLQLDQWEDKQTGDKRSKLRVVGEAMQMLDRRQGNRSGGQDESRTPADSYYDAPETHTPTGDDVPF